jgi:hypothetical protein
MPFDLRGRFGFRHSGVCSRTFRALNVVQLAEEQEWAKSHGLHGRSLKKGEIRI